MTFGKRVLLLGLTVLLAFTLGCAATSTREGTGEYFDDSAITAKVKAAFLQEPTLKSFEITVETFKGVVQLSGFVSSKADTIRATEVARKVRGVRDVHNNMLVKGQQ
jgi:osmotically-inducible protein OsmY